MQKGGPTSDEIDMIVNPISWTCSYTIISGATDMVDEFEAGQEGKLKTAEKKPNDLCRHISPVK